MDLLQWSSVICDQSDLSNKFLPHKRYQILGEQSLYWSAPTQKRGCQQLSHNVKRASNFVRFDQSERDFPHILEIFRSNSYLWNGSKAKPWDLCETEFTRPIYSFFLFLDPEIWHTTWDSSQISHAPLSPFIGSSIPEWSFWSAGSVNYWFGLALLIFSYLVIDLL